MLSVHKAKQDRLSRIQSPVKKWHVQQLGEVRCVLARDGVVMTSGELLKKNLCGYGKNSKSESTVIKNAKPYFEGCSSEVF